ncbi:MAG: response regulator transcription factor [Sulfuritalea sp.]|jgi:DNA-binding NarL/FixJ family response regulator|nr:response regulator transcription factor [Sulfuritalea sp.]MBP8897679.1 response regulator transcription factor [Sulfuritalea sp.]
MTRIIIADDHTLFRIGLKQMLESFDGVSVVAEAANAAQTLDVVQGVAADLLVSDLTMPGTCGTQLIEQLHRQHPSLPILILSMHDEPATVRRALQAGASGYLTKESSPAMLQAAVRQVAAGERFIPPALAETLAFESVRARGLPHETLSQRERQIFKLIAQGVSLNQIAEQLHLSPKTVTTHKTHLMEKLGIANNAELIRYAIEHKLFD